jgi:hypothetical protein
MLTELITQVWQYLYNYSHLPIAGIATCLAFTSNDDLAIYYSISLSLPSHTRLSSSASLSCLFKEGNDLLLAPDSTKKCQPAPPQQIVQSTGTCTRTSTSLLCQPAIPAATGISSRYNLQIGPSAHTPQPPNRKVPLPAARSTGPPSPRAVTSLGYSLERSLTPRAPPQIASSQGPGPPTSATPSRRSSPLVHPRAGLAER